MKNYKLREGENIRKPVVKRDRIEIRMPVLLICLVLSFVVWLYIVSLSKLNELLRLLVGLAHRLFKKYCLSRVKSSFRVLVMIA